MARQSICPGPSNSPHASRKVNWAGVSRAQPASNANSTFCFISRTWYSCADQIDLWFEEAGEELMVVDYKETDRMADGESPSAAYALQLQIYALALERSAGRIADRAVLYYLRRTKRSRCRSIRSRLAQPYRRFSTRRIPSNIL